MEHRWGRRVPLGITTILSGISFGVLHGRLRDASISGAFVEVPNGPGPMTHLTIALKPRDGKSQKIAAFVVRSDSEGIALEWSQLAPSALVTMIADARRKGRKAPARTAVPDHHGAMTRLSTLDSIACGRRGLSASIPVEVPLQADANHAWAGNPTRLLQAQAFYAPNSRLSKEACAHMQRPHYNGQQPCLFTARTGRYLEDP